jgi:hypothetical protein
MLQMDIFGVLQAIEIYPLNPVFSGIIQTMLVQLSKIALVTVLFHSEIRFYRGRSTTVYYQTGQTNQLILDKAPKISGIIGIPEYEPTTLPFKNYLRGDIL